MNKFDNDNEISFYEFKNLSKKIRSVKEITLNILSKIGFEETKYDTYFCANEKPQLNNNKGLYFMGNKGFSCCHIWEYKDGYLIHLIDLISISDRFYFYDNLECFVDFIEEIKK